MAEKRKYQKEIVPIHANELGKLPPQATDIEELVLGALMVESDAYANVSDFLKPEHFYKTANQKIFSAIEMLVMLGEPTDFRMVTNKLRDLGIIDEVGGAYYITILSTQVNSTYYLEKHAKVIYEKFLARESIRVSNEIQSMAYDGSDVFEILAYANKQFSDISGFSTGNILTMYDAIEQMRNNIFKNSSDSVVSSGSITGFEKFDNRGGGFQKSDFIVIAAESSQGKTSLALSIADNIANNGGSLGFYSLEMRAIQLASRFTAFHTNIPANEILYSRFNNERFGQLDKNIKRLLDYNIYIDEKSNSTVESIINSIRGLKKLYNIEGAFVDYLQLVTTSEKWMNKEQQTAYISRSFKNAAKELDIWIVGLSQLARDNSNPIPSIKRLRDSGQIEEACDVCFLIYRPEQVGRTNFPEPFDDFNVKDTAMIDIAKGRNIGTFKFLSHFDSRITHFSDIENYDIIRNIAVPVNKKPTDTPF